MGTQLHLSAKEYNLLISKQGKQNSIKNIPHKSRKEPLQDVHYTYNIQFDNDIIVVTLLGKHFSKNVTNSMSLKDLMRFKTKLKNSSYHFFLLNPKMKKFCKQWDKVTIHYDIYNPRSRDTHNTDLKTFRDTFTNVGIIKDDNRTVIPFPPTEREIISKEYKIIATIRKLSSKGTKAQKVRASLNYATSLLSDNDCIALETFAKSNKIDISKALSKAINVLQ